MAPKRYYVTRMVDGKVRLIDASSPAQVSQHVARKLILSIAPATVREVVELRNDGVEIEDAGAA